MTKDEVHAWLARDRAVLAFDTNAVFGRSFLTLCNTVNSINQIRQPDQAIAMVVPTPVHFERVYDERQRRGPLFDAAIIDAMLHSKGVDVVAFDRPHADRTAELLGTQYPDKTDWQHFKRDRCLSCLGLKKYRAEAAAAGKKCGATIDWLIAGYADAEGCLLVTDDTGPEFRGVPNRTRLDTLRSVVDELLAALKGRPGQRLDGV